MFTGGGRMRLIALLDDLENMMRRGHRLKAIVSDISILPRKPDSTSTK